jgi:hypothetical protein
MSKSKIVDYYKPDDERMDEYYLGHTKMLGLDKHPFGLDEHGTLRFESKDTDSKIWKRYKELGGSEDETGDLNTLWVEYSNGKFAMDEMMQFYREIGYSLCGYVDVWSERFYAIEDAAEFQRALDKLSGTEDLEQAKQDIMNTFLLAHLDSVEDELIFKYRKEAKKIVNKNFGEGAWEEFIQSVRNKKIN